MKVAKPLNVWIAEVSLNGRKSCPTCHVKLDDTNAIVSVGQYISVTYRKAFYACRDCFKQSLRAVLWMDSKYQVRVRNGCSVRWFKGEI